MWNIWDVGCSGCGMLGVWEIRGSIKFKMCDVYDVGFFG